MSETNHYQMKESEYVSKKNIGRALEEIAKQLITPKDSLFFSRRQNENTKNKKIKEWKI